MKITETKKCKIRNYFKTLFVNMAADRFLIFCLVLLLLEATSLDRQRAGGSRGVRGGRSRSTTSYSRSSVVRSYQNVVLSGRIVTGSSPFTIATWRSAAIIGSIYGGRAYILKHPHERKLPPICTNNKEKSPEGRAYGYFICPREREPDDYKYCCGAESREYCCNKTMAQTFYSEQKKSTGTSIGVIIGIITAVIISIFVGAYCCKKRKHTEDVIRKFSKREHRPSQRLPLRSLGLLQPTFAKGASKLGEKSDAQTGDGNRPAESFEGIGLTPSIPPPSYNAATTTTLGGFDVATGYGLPQIQPHFNGNKFGFESLEGSAKPFLPSTPDQDAAAAGQQFDGVPSCPPSNRTPLGPPSNVLYSLSDGASYLPPCRPQISPMNSTAYSPSSVDPFLPAESAPSEHLSGAPHSPTRNPDSHSASNPCSPSTGNPFSATCHTTYTPSQGAPYLPSSNTQQSPSAGAPHSLSYEASFSPSHETTNPPSVSTPRSLSTGNPFLPSSGVPQSCLDGAINLASATPRSSSTGNPFSTAYSCPYPPYGSIPHSLSAGDPYSPSKTQTSMGRALHPSTESTINPSIDESTYLPSNGQTLSLKAGVPYSKSAPPYLLSSPTFSSPNYSDTSFYPRSTSGAAL